MIDESLLRDKLNTLTESEIKELALKMLITQEKTKLRVRKTREKNKRKDEINNEK